MQGALERCVGDPGRFGLEHWGRRTLLTRNPGGEDFGDLFGLDAVDELLTTTLLRTPAFRLVRDGQRLDPATYTRRLRLGARMLSDVADAGRVLAHFADGATIVLQGLHRYWLPLTRFCRDLELTLGHVVQANAYVTPADARGLAPHVDTHDVFLLQVHGVKHWAVSEPGADEAAPPDLDAELHPGDALYLPTGARHAARAMATASVHVTIGVLATTWGRVVGDVVRRVGAELGHGAPLPLGYHEDDAFPVALAARLRELAARVEDAGPDAHATWRAARERFLATRTPTLRGSLPALVEVDGIADDTPVVRRRGAVAQVVPDGAQVSLVLGDRTLRLPAEVEPALRHVAEAEALAPVDLAPHLDEASRGVLVRRLVREGLLERAP